MHVSNRLRDISLERKISQPKTVWTTVTIKPVMKLLRNTCPPPELKPSAKRPTTNIKGSYLLLVGESTRHCKQNGIWNYPDYSHCSSEEFVQLKEKVSL